ncbi:hypothetical protein GCM10020358_51190 [Amorphoplanes nipponensis]|uniref:hypothetical protein n=1 Tax=Actinoplanes nipponensis TaxID=135950 RepID=UPI0031E89B1A
MAALLPLAVAALLAVPLGRARAAAGWWLRLRSRLLGPLPPGGAGVAGRPGRAGGLVVAGHAVLSLLLGAVALLPFGALLAFVFRGVCYGLVDPGPYDTSWGGPSRAGAWAAHFLVGLPMAAVALLLLAGLAALHGRLSGVLAGQRPARWVFAVALTVPLPAVALFVAWLHQI